MKNTKETDTIEAQNGEVEREKTLKEKLDLLYSVDEVPPWYLCIFLGLQQYLTAFGSIMAIPRILAPALCMDEDYLGLSEVTGTIFFVSGVCTLLQTTIGCRLPIIQGATFAFLAPTFAYLSLQCCPFTDKNNCNMTLPEVGSPEHKEIWQGRMTEVQGAIMVSSVFQVVIGFSGLMGFILRFIGPLAIVPTITLVGLSLFTAAANFCDDQWWIAIMTIFFVVLFSQYLRNVKVPIPTYTRGVGCGIGRIQLFRLFPILLGMCLSWLVCYILTITDALPTEKTGWGYWARTDSQDSVLTNAAWFRFPYPGQWGVPVVTTAGVFGMVAGVLASMVESVGDYYACARLSGAVPPPEHAVNRGIGVEGIGCIIAGAWGSGNGTTSYSQNIGSIGITKVGSRRVVQVGGVIMIFLGCLGKFGALFVTIPNPVIGGMFVVMFGMVAAVGLSTLQFVDLNSSRNLFIFGFAIFSGLTLPSWLGRNPGAIKTGSDVVNQILTVLCSTNMFVGGFLGFLLDNTIPGTDEERGIIKWRKQIKTDKSEDSRQVLKTYDLPFIQKYLNRMSCATYLPFCPTFRGFGTIFSSTQKDMESTEPSVEIYRTNPGYANSEVETVNENDVTTDGKIGESSGSHVKTV